jgi:hypothetical protein
MFTFKTSYFLIFCFLLITETLIALYVHDNFIRPYIGDLLVVILIYCFLRSIFNIKVWTAAISTLLFSFVVETLQYFQIVNRLGLQHSKFARIVVGTSFAWNDILAYIAGIGIVLIFEKWFIKKNNNYFF